VRHLAAAPDEEVFKLWEGLGYYSRCRNLLAAARQVAGQFGGAFPSTYADILLLKGVGHYTAAAIASFAFGLPHAVTDGNVVRILARFFGQGLPFDSAEGQQWFRKKAQELLPHDQPAAFNQAMMDFGATVCKPRNPDCDICPLRPECRAFRKGMVENLPTRGRKPAIKTRHFMIMVIRGPQGWLVRKRMDKDIWQHLYEFLMLEQSGPDPASPDQLVALAAEKVGLKVTVRATLPEKSQQLTHQLIKARIVHCSTQSKKQVNGYQWVSTEKLHSLAFPRLLTEMIKALDY
jgi:A/G-specific adenine glycosylase